MIHWVAPLANEIVKTFIKTKLNLSIQKGYWYWGLIIITHSLLNAQLAKAQFLYYGAHKMYDYAHYAHVNTMKHINVWIC